MGPGARSYPPSGATASCSACRQAKRDMIPFSAAAPDDDPVTHSQKDSLQSLHTPTLTAPAGHLPELAVHGVQGSDVAPVSCLVGAYIR